MQILKPVGYVHLHVHSSYSLLEGALKIGDLVSCYADIVKVGRTSITINVQVWATPHYEPAEPEMVTEGTFTYVAIDQDRRPRPVPP